jgi:hypothetical protein
VSATLADIVQDARAFAAACEELAEHLDATAARLKTPGLLESQEMAFLRVLPLMCAFASPEVMAAFAARLRGLAARLDALPASADDLAKVMAAPAAEFEAFEALIFGAGSTRVDPETNERNVSFKEGGTLL